MPPSSAHARFDPILAQLGDLVGRGTTGREPDPAGGLVHVHFSPPCAARTGEPTAAIADSVRSRLGIDEFWSHQAAAIDLALGGRSVVLASGTASGKSLVSQVAIGTACAGDRPATALLLFPTKALGHDQLRALDELELPGVVAAAYDGDSTDNERVWVRRHANVICTNPDMLHVGILPRHGQWATFLRRLQYVVVDETHTLRGIFGGHVAHVLRRLRRQCAALGASPTFIFSSATIADPARLTSLLCGDEVTAVTDDGAPRGERLVALVNPPLLDAQSGARASAHRITADIATALVEADHRTIVFCRSRHATETVTAAIRRNLPDELAETVQSYRAGYLTAERRAIEADLSSGRLRAIVATSALELGIDIGGLDACVVHGFPGTVASFRQQIGRVGRGSTPSLAVLVAGTDQLDQYLAAHPDELFDRPVEPVVVNPANPFVLDPQLCCAAAEHPLVSADATWWGDDLDDGIRRLVLDDRLRVQHVTAADGHVEPRAVWAGHGHPAGNVGLRSGSGREIRIVLDDGTLVGTVDAGRATTTVHPGANYLHRTEPYRVVELNFEDGYALVEPDDGTTTTRTRSHTDLTLLGTDTTQEVGRFGLGLGPVAVRATVTGYQRIDIATGQVVDSVELILPTSTLVTRAFWYTVPAEVIAASVRDPEQFPGALHALEHAAISMLPLFAICDRWDVGGISTAWFDDTQMATVAIYDGYPGGAGIAELGFAAADRHLATTLDMMRSCPCAAGCPSCIQSPKCGNGNEPLDKAAAIALAEIGLART